MAVKSNTGDGNWNDKTTWTPAGAPSASDTVKLNYDRPATVTLTGTGNAAITEISNQQVLDLVGGNLGGTIRILNGGRLQAVSGSNATDGTVQLRDAGSRLGISDGATLRIGTDGASVRNAGDLSLSSSGAVTQLLFGAGISFTTDLNVNSAFYEYEGGTVTLSDSANNIITAAGDRGTITNVNNTIQGAGRLGAGKASVVNKAAVGNGTKTNDHAQGVIRATGTNNALVIDVGPTGSLNNGGLIQGIGKAGLVIGNSNLQLGAATVVNTGTIEAGAGSKVVLAHVNVAQTSDFTKAIGTIRTTGVGAELDLQDTTIAGGTVATVAGSTLSAAGQDVLTNVTLTGAGALNVGSGASLVLKGGTASTAGLIDAGAITFDSALTLQGAAAVSITGSLTGSGAGATLANVDESILATGSIKAAALSNQSGGKIDGSHVMMLDVGTLTNAGELDNGIITANSVTNTGTMAFDNITAGQLTNNGVISNATITVPHSQNVVNGKTGIINGAVFSSTTVINQGLVEADGDGNRVVLSGTEITSGILSTSNGGLIEVAAFATHLTSLDPEAIASGTQFVIDDGASAQIGNTSLTPMILDGVGIDVSSGGDTTTLNMEGGPLVLQGGGKIKLSDSANNKIQLGAFTNAAATISGAGQVEAVTLDNRVGGTILANGSNSLTVTVGTLKNTGTLEADDATLEIVSPNTIQGAGNVLVTDGGTVDLSGTAGYLGNLVYSGAGTIEGSLAVPTGTISGFATGDEFIFGNASNPGLLEPTWQENPDGTGGTLTIRPYFGQTYTLQFAGVYDASDFTASYVTLSDGEHLAVTFTGALRWADAVSGNWQDASAWTPGGLYVPGPNDDALITVGGAAYTVTVNHDTTVKSVATGTSATLDIQTGSTLMTATGTASVANAGTVAVESGAAFVIGGTFQQVATGLITAVGLDALIDISMGGTVSGGKISTDDQAVLNAAGGSAVLDTVTFSNNGFLDVANETTLTLTVSQVTGAGEIDVEQGSTLALTESTISGNTVELAGNLQINADTTWRSSIDLLGGAIVSGGSSKTFWNFGVIRGNGFIGDPNLTLVNEGLIIAEADDDFSTISLSTGLHTILNKGSIVAQTGTKVSVASALENDLGVNASGGTVLFDNAVTNSGLIAATDGTSVLAFSGTLANWSSVSASGGGLIDISGQVTQKATGKLLGSGDGTILNLHGGSSVTGGQIALTDNTDLTVGTGAVTLSNLDLSLDTGSFLIVSSMLKLVDSELDTVDGTSAVKVAGTSAVLALRDTTLNGGHYLISGGASIQVSGEGDLIAQDTSINLGSATRIVSDGTAATLTNAGIILGANGFIGDGNLTLHNQGSMAVGFANDSLAINTGSNTIVNDGTITASVTGALLAIGSTLQNTTSGTLRTGGGTVTTVDVENAGLVSADAGGFMQIKGQLDNSGQVTATGNGVLQALALDNSGELLSTGAGSTLTIGDGSGAATNSGQIVADNFGTVEFNGGLNQLSGGKLLAQGSGQITILGAATGGIATMTNGGIVDFEGSASATTTTNAVFQGDTSELLMLNNATQFAGTVSGMGTGDSIDVEDIAYVAGDSFYDPSKGQLDLSDGTTSVNIQLLGSYSADEFAFSSDGHGGTLVSQPATADLTLVGDNSDNLLVGGNGNDFIYGVGGNDTLIGGAGTDYLYGEDGDDVLLGGTALQGGANQLWGGTGNDTASYAGTTGTVYADLGAGAGYVDDVLTDQYNSIENLIGGSGSNTLVGDAGNNVLKGGGVDDYLYGEAGDDILIGGTALPGGTNQLWGGTGSDTASYAGTTQGVYASISEHGAWIGDVLVDQYNSIENLTGGSGNDTLVGDAGANVLNGGAGADVLWGEGGADSFVYTTYSDSNLVSGYDTIADFVPGTSKLDLTAMHTDAMHVQIVSSMAAGSTSLYVEQTPGTFNAATDLAISFVGANAIKMSDIKFA